MENSTIDIKEMEGVHNYLKANYEEDALAERLKKDIKDIEREQMHC